MTRQKGENTYKSILKGNSIFGGMQMFQILISLVRGKFVAMFLGPAGMGMASLFTAT
ncbi:MAG TPA: O-antigen translocase, partial [Porphyromonadaceae bacterium]|nr:O-antigen translocase [Porphyromonadaceae bacterium]